MPLNYDIGLLLISVIATTGSVFISFGLLNRIQRSALPDRKLFQIIFGLVAGAGICLNHYAISISANHITTLTSPIYLLYGWLFATVIGSNFVYLYTLQHPKTHHYLSCGVIAGLADLGLFYSSYSSLLSQEKIQLGSAILGTIFSITVITFALMQFQWMKSYLGKHRILVRAALSLSIALSIVCIHFVYNAVFTDTNIIHIGSTSSTQMRMTGLTIALSILCVFMGLFLFLLVYEKHGKKLFKLRLFKTNTKANIHQDSLEDSLTKLPNRRAFETHLATAEKRCRRSGKSLALAYIDLDHFKPINDNYGHHIGDAVLSITAERLNTAIRGCDLVARIGGDEFVAILEEIDSNDDVKPIAERIVNAISEPFFIDHLNIELSCSVGIAIYPEDSTLDKLLVCADAAMYKAKDQGKNQYKFYDAEIESANDLLINMQKDLCLAIENEEFSIAYQPKIDCKTLAATGAEALIRWTHPTKGKILPNDFLPTAEHFGMINEINDWVIRECCSTLAEAKASGLDLTISINLSSHQFSDPNLVKNIIKTIDEFDLDPSAIAFEIKETTAINNQKQFKTLLEKFKSAGIKVILDDFGLLPISFTYLIDLNIDEIKIDKSFTSMVTKDTSSKALIDAILKLAQALDLRTTAEGIETEDQQEAILDLGCDYMQGYLFSKPVAKDEFFLLFKKLQFKQLQIDFNHAQPKANKT